MALCLRRKQSHALSLCLRFNKPQPKNERQTMGFALDLQTYAVTAPGAAGAAAAAYTGDTLTIRNARRGTDILTIAMCTLAQAVGFTQIVSPSMHDMVRGFRYRNAPLANDGQLNKIPRAFPLHWKPQDPLTITQAGSAVAGDVELVSLLNWYEDLPGVEANLINTAELRSRGVNMMTVEDTITPTSAAAYSGQRVLNQAADLFKADTEYAILGMSFGSVPGTGFLSVRGVDTGNLRVGGPVMLAYEDSRDWFAQLSESMDLPCIPVINSANRAGTFIEASCNENFVATPFALHLCQLAPRPVKNPGSVVPAATP